MTIEHIIAVLSFDAKVRHVLNERYESAGKYIPDSMLEVLQAQEEACIILKEVQKLYEKTKKEDFGED